MFDPASIYQFMAAKTGAGLRVALVTAIGVEGSSTRNPGTQMAVAEDGTFAGSFSGGCIEAAIVAEALATLSQGAPREIRYGPGSPYIDIRLPCGGALDLHIFPAVDRQLAAAALAHLASRRPFAICLSRRDATLGLSPSNGVPGVAISADTVTVDHVPPLRLAVMGTGDIVPTLARLAMQIGVPVAICRPEGAAQQALPTGVDEIATLKSPSDPLPIAIDAWTAVALFFHDHDWEPLLLRQLLASNAFLIGAMGSRRTHAARLEQLARTGVAKEEALRIRSPIGLLPAMRDPETMAVSVLAEAVGEYNARFHASAGRLPAP